MRVNRLCCPIIVLGNEDKQVAEKEKGVLITPFHTRPGLAYSLSCSFEDKMAPIRWKSVGAGSATDSRPSSRNSMGRPAIRQSARLARTSSSSGVATPMIDESDLTDTVAADISPNKLSESIKVEIQVENEVRLTRTGRGSRLLIRC